MARASDLLERARRAASVGRYASAATALDAAQAASDDAALTAQAEVLRAYVESETGHPRDGITRLRRVLALPGLDPVTEGKAWQQLGLLRMRTGDSGEALAAFARVVEGEGVDPVDVGFAHLNRGGVHLQHGDSTTAAADFAAARDLLGGPGLEVQRAKAEHNLGYARLLTGDLVGALRDIERAAVVLSPVSAVNRATVEQDRAEILTAAGRPQEAVRALESAATAYGRRRLRTFQAECELALAWTVLREDPARARVVARRAARRFRDQASPIRALQADAAATVAEISTGATAPSVLARADRLVDQLTGSGHRRDAELLHLQTVRVAIARGDLAGAGQRLRRLRPGADAPVATRLLEREVRAELARARGDRRRAREQVRDGLAELHAWQSSFGSLDLQSTLVGHGRALALQGLALAFDDGGAPLVLEWTERARALVGRVTPVRPPADEQVATDLAELRTTADRREARRLRERIRQRSWHAAGGGEVGEPVALADLQQALGEDDAALVSHTVVGADLHALVVTGDDAHVVPLGSARGLRGRLDAATADLTAAAEHRTGPLAGAVRAGLGPRLADLAEQLVDPLADLLGDRRVVLSPSGLLAGTPWPLLPGLRGRPLVLAPSATRWVELRALPTDLTRVGLVAGPGLERAEEEVTRAAAQWEGTELLCGEDATADAVSDLAARVDVLHLAGHGTHPGENPLFAAIRLADGPWYGYDVDRLPSVPSTVVLSACELGRASVRSGEESVGMTAAWLHAGARTVVSSPVVIADDVACEALAQWHALLASGTPAADALALLDVDDLVPLVCAGAGW